MYLGIDYGRKRIGLALGAVLPRGAGTIEVKDNLDKVVQEIILICKENDVKAIVIGMPFRSQGEKGSTSSEIEAFAKILEEKSGLEIFFEPEQYTSSEAEKNIKENLGKRSRDKGRIDEEAAILILEQFLRSR